MRMMLLEFKDALGLNEPELYNILRNMLKKSDTVMDIGANIGFVTLALSRRVGNAGAVYSFEPIPSTYNILHKNV